MLSEMCSVEDWLALLFYTPMRRKMTVSIFDMREESTFLFLL